MISIFGDILRKGFKTSEYIMLAIAALILIGDSILSSLTGTSLFDKYPDVRHFIEQGSIVWAALRTGLKAIVAVVQYTQGQFSSTQAPVVDQQVSVG